MRSGQHRIFDAIPQDVINYWLEGKYIQGPHRPMSYDFLGWSLMVRGCYLYESFQGAQDTVWGYCLFDLDNGDLYCAGLTLNSVSSDQPEGDEANHPLLWRSEVCKVKSGPSQDKATLICIYRVVYPPTDRKEDTWKPIEDLHDRFKKHWPEKQMAGPEPDRDPKLREESIAYLKGQFDIDWKKLEGNDAKNEELLNTSFFGMLILTLEKFGPKDRVKFAGHFRAARPPKLTGKFQLKRIC
jgi:hypothetical protein